MTITPHNNNILHINGFAIARGLLAAREVRRCELSECQGHCCGWGVSISLAQAQEILAHHQLFQPHLPPERQAPEGWFDWEVEIESDHPAGGMLVSTAVVLDPTHPTGHNCVFLRPDRKCALQVASMAAGEHPWRYKPFYCALHPITFSNHVIMLDEDNPLYIKGGSCQRPNPGRPIPLYRLFAAELTLALGEEGYAELERVAAQMETAQRVP